MSIARLSAATIARLAEVEGIPLADADSAERIAAGAGAAIAVVREQLAAGWPRLPGAGDAAGDDTAGNPLCDYEPGDFLATLERLADEPGPAPTPR